MAHLVTSCFCLFSHQDFLSPSLDLEIWFSYNSLELSDQTQTRSCDAGSPTCTKESSQLMKKIHARLQAQNSKDLEFSNVPNHSKLDEFKEKRQAVSSWDV
ncbi:hypothetical protein OIU78_007417 [Salix suchowensis]|nr:hypothetical protein OIU78_007417 [Salix suchowensis]